MTRDSRTAVACAGAILAVFLALAPLTSLWDRDEPRFAQAAIEMQASGNYLMPTFNGEWRTQKPPLVTWLMSLSMQLLGPSAFAARVWSPLGLTVAALATWTVGRRLWSARVGAMSMIIMALNPLALVQGAAATADAILLASITSAIAVGVRMLAQPPTWREGLAMGAVMGLGLLTKGPVALALPLAILGVSTWACRAERTWSRAVTMQLAFAAAIATVIYAMWIVPAAAATGGLAIERGLIGENLGRFLIPMEGHGTPLLLAPLYYPAVILVGLLPWSRHLRAAATHRHSTEVFRPLARTLLLAWVIVPLLAFTIAATKLPHYILPIWPALALGIAAVLGRRDADAALHALAGRAGVAAVAIVAVAAVAAPSVEALKPVPPIAAAVRDSGVDGPLHTFGFEEPSLVFYSGRRTIAIGSAPALVAWASDPAPAVLVAPRDRIQEIERHAGPLDLVEIASRAGWNYVKGERLELVAFARGRKP